jgi:hypothetical protein
VDGSCDPDYTSTYFKVSVSIGLPNGVQDLGGLFPGAQIVLNVTYLPANYTEERLNSSSSIKTLVAKSCILSGGLVSYDIILQNQTIGLRYDDYLNDEFLESL